MSLAQGMEAASLNAQSLKGQDNPIHRTSMHGRQSYGKGPPSGGDGNKLCYCCGRSNHTPADCRFRDAECHNCGKKGHIAPACCGKSKKPSQQSGQPSKGGRQRKPKPQREQWVAEENPGSSADELPIYTLRDSSRLLHAEVKLNEKSVRMEVDTGAAVSLIS